jgi:uncharacterized membrane protein YphA (DoxX/SURF4 family)
VSEVDAVLLILRLGPGGMLAAHGVNKVLGAGGLEGRSRWFEALGFRPAGLHARVAAMTEFGAGSLMIVGLLTPPSLRRLCGVDLSSHLIAKAQAEDGLRRPGSGLLFTHHGIGANGIVSTLMRVLVAAAALGVRPHGPRLRAAHQTGRRLAHDELQGSDVWTR